MEDSDGILFLYYCFSSFLQKFFGSATLFYIHNRDRTLGRC